MSPNLKEKRNLMKFKLNKDNNLTAELSVLYFNLAHQNQMLIQLSV